jgi:hypothetical protein
MSVVCAGGWKRAGVLRRRYLTGFMLLAITGVGSAQTISSLGGGFSGDSAALSTSEWAGVRGRGAESPVRRGVAFSRLGLGVDLSTLGFGFEAATPLSPRTNLRLEGNFFDLSQSFSVASIRIGGDVQLRSAIAGVDYQPFHWLGLYVTPGLMVYNGNRLIGTAMVKGGTAFFPGNGHYTSSPADPVHGSLTVALGSIAPVLTVGFDNVLPRSGRHWSIPLEAGIAYTGTPSATLALQGSVCDPNGTNCRPIPTAPDVVANIALEAARVSGTVSFLQVYPIVKIGYVYNFRLRPGR